MTDKPVPKAKPKKKEEYIVVRQLLTASGGANECFGIFSKLSKAEGWINGRDRPQEYYVLPLNRLSKEEQ